ncbi:MAG TPA: carboxylesterase, partial [Mycobacterium sp.]|nr:carboxylesterase [Mycobacterium sp.]
MPAGLVRAATALLAVVLVATGCGRPAPTAAAVVVTSAGPVRGSVAPDVRIFQGIPYAAAPAGPLRWQPPVAPVRWNAVRDATQPGLRCIQDTRVDPDYGLATSEDCLNLTVWSPSGAT